MKPNYSNYGLSISMGKLLRKEVETQLTNDLTKYGIDNNGLLFDWSNSCIEGRCANYLDGSVDCFSGIKLFNNNDILLADGWMDFIIEKDYDIFIVYWDYLSIYENNKRVKIKETPGIPPHIIELLPDKLKEKYRTN
jgi:hypothetical protein